MACLLQLINLHWHIFITQSLQFTLFHFWCCTFYGYSQMYNDMYPPLYYYTEYFHYLKNPLGSACSPPSNPQLLATTDFLRSPQFCLFSECHIDGIIQYVAFPDWVLSRNNMHLNFFQFFYWFNSSFLFIANIPLPRCTTVYLSIHLLKKILVAYKFWQLWIKLLYIFMCRFCADINFHLLWVNTKECDCQSVW